MTSFLSLKCGTTSLITSQPKPTSSILSRKSTKSKLFLKNPVHFLQFPYLAHDRFEVKGRTDLEQIIGISLFRNDITPEWADPENKNGSEYQLMLEECQNPEIIDEFWQDLIIKVIGETLEHSDQVINSSMNSFSNHSPLKDKWNSTYRQVKRRFRYQA